MKQTAVLVVALVILLGILFALMPYVKTPGAGRLAGSEQAFELKTERIEEETDAYAINVQYPQFNNAVIDEQIRNDVQTAVAEFKTYPPVPHDSAAIKNDLICSYDSVYVGSDVISVRLAISEYTGGAHPTTAFVGENFDRASGRRLVLADALRLIGKTLDDVAVEARTTLQNRLADAFFEEGVAVNVDNFSSFVVSDKAVIFIFQEYQVAPYADGEQEISFPRI